MRGMVSYTQAAMERAMKVQEVILRAMAKRITWWQAAEIIGISDRQMRRWRERYGEHTSQTGSTRASGRLTTSSGLRPRRPTNFKARSYFCYNPRRIKLNSMSDERRQSERLP